MSYRNCELGRMYLKGGPQVLQPCPQHVAKGVLKGHPEHHHRTAVMPVEIDTLRYLDIEKKKIIKEVIAR